MQRKHFGTVKINKHPERRQVVAFLSGVLLFIPLSNTDTALPDSNSCKDCCRRYHNINQVGITKEVEVISECNKNDVHKNKYGGRLQVRISYIGKNMVDMTSVGFKWAATAHNSNGKYPECVEHGNNKNCKR